ncbi:hypothetical protein [Microcella sp.]|uniref:hypothetical protein n=1 Tax=Microcella sp. TaxID=1913979 RepID=UPI00299F5373|nr:hypothetical protein [Microcella sp.]MDX2026758.1 hypothetical protein [Microcella sp.]
MGPSGPPGPPGADAVSEYAYFVSFAEQTLLPDTNVDLIGPIGGSGNFALVNSGLEISVATSGTYAVWYSVTTTDRSQFGVTIDGSVWLFSVSASNSGAQTNGMSILNLQAGDLLGLRNISDATSVPRPTFATETEPTVNASLMIQKID